MTRDRVGPVVDNGEVGAAVVAAIRADNSDVEVIDRGAYLRVAVPAPCVLRRATVEEALGRAFVLPADLERVMPSFVGRFVVDEETASWHSNKP